MTFRFLFSCILAAIALGVSSCATAPDALESSELFHSTTAKKLLKVEGDIGRICRDTLGYVYPQTEITWQQLESSRVWELAAIGKHGVIISHFEISGGKIVRSSIVSSKERRGRQIKSTSYLRQITGISLSDKSELDRRVDGITGATISSKAVHSAALLALRLDANVPDKQGGVSPYICTLLC